MLSGYLEDAPFPLESVWTLLSAQANFPLSCPLLQRLHLFSGWRSVPNALEFLMDTWLYLIIAEMKGIKRIMEKVYEL